MPQDLESSSAIPGDDAGDCGEVSNDESHSLPERRGFQCGSFEGPIRLAGHLQSVMLMRAPRLNHEARKRLEHYQSKWWANEQLEPASTEALKVEPGAIRSMRLAI